MNTNRDHDLFQPLATGELQVDETTAKKYGLKLAQILLKVHSGKIKNKVAQFCELQSHLQTVYTKFCSPAMGEIAKHECLSVDRLKKMVHEQ